MTKEEKGKFAFDRFVAGAKSDTARDYWYSKWQGSRIYNEQEVIMAFNEGQALSFRGKLIQGKEWFEQSKKQDALNLDELESKLDNSLSKETTESLTEWLDNKRNNMTEQEAIDRINAALDRIEAKLDSVDEVLNKINGEIDKHKDKPSKTITNEYDGEVMFRNKRWAELKSYINTSKNR
jgi:chromosome condensin MukBEF ATPase and DNA-binding subunit MukB